MFKDIFYIMFFYRNLRGGNEFRFMSKLKRLFFKKASLNTEDEIMNKLLSDDMH